MAVKLDSKGEMSLGFNGISNEGDGIFAHLTAPPEIWAEIFDIIQTFHDSGISLQAYTGISDIHAAHVIKELSQHVQSGANDFVIKEEDFRAIDALIAEYEKHGYGRLKDPQNTNTINQDRYLHLRDECSAVRTAIEAAL